MRNSRVNHTAGCASLPFLASSAKAARSHLRRALAEVGGPTDLVDDTCLVISELVSNAIQHGRPTSDGAIEVSWSATALGADVAVTDSGTSDTIAPRPSLATDTRGRGLALVAALCSTWDVRREDGNTTVMATVPAAPVGRLRLVSPDPPG